MGGEEGLTPCQHDDINQYIAPGQIGQGQACKIDQRTRDKGDVGWCHEAGILKVQLTPDITHAWAQSSNFYKRTGGIRKAVLSS